jgi:outer membrane protein assembly factor BamB
VDDRHVYVAEPGGLHAIGLDDPSERWSADVFPSNFSSPTLAEGSVYIGTRTGDVAAVNTTSGAIEWQRTISSGETVNTTPAVGADRVYAGAEDSRVYALNTREGTQAWQATVPAPVRTAPVLTDEHLLAPAVDGTLISLDPSSSSEQWRVSVDASTVSSPAVANGQLYWATESTVHAIELESGTKQWTFETDGFSGLNNVAPPPVLVGDAVYFTTGHESVYAVDVRSGEEYWQFTPGSGANVLTVTVVGSTAFVGTDAGTVHQLRGRTNLRPEPSISYLPRDPVVGEEVTFDAEGSRDPDGEITTYEWDVDGDGTFETTGSRISHTYASAGEYQVRLRVTDDAGRTATSRLGTPLSVSTPQGTASSATEPGRQSLSVVDRVPGGIVGSGAISGVTLLGVLYGASRLIGRSKEEGDNIESENHKPDHERPDQRSVRSNSKPTQLYPETSYSDYEAVGQIHAGYQVETVEAVVDQYDEHVALKRLRLDDSETVDRSMLAEFVDGIEKWDRIDDHEHILTVFDYGEQPVPWVAIELADREFDPTVFSHLSDEQKFDFVTQLCEAVHHGHRHGLAHGSLTSSNILVVETASGPSLRVADWQVNNSVLGRPSRESTTGSAGQQEGGLSATQESDIYQLGLFALSLFIGEKIPDKEAAEKAINGADDLRPALRTVFESVLSPDGNRTYDTALHFRDALRNALDTQV